MQAELTVTQMRQFIEYIHSQEYNYLQKTKNLLVYLNNFTTHYNTIVNRAATRVNSHGDICSQTDPEFHNGLRDLFTQYNNQIVAEEVARKAKEKADEAQRKAKVEAVRKADEEATQKHVEHSAQQAAKKAKEQEFDNFTMYEPSHRLRQVAQVKQVKNNSLVVQAQKNGQVEYQYSDEFVEALTYIHNTIKLQNFHAHVKDQNIYLLLYKVMENTQLENNCKTKTCVSTQTIQQWKQIMCSDGKQDHPTLIQLLIIAYASIHLEMNTGSQPINSPIPDPIDLQVTINVWVTQHTQQPRGGSSTRTKTIMHQKPKPRKSRSTKANK